MKRIGLIGLLKMELPGRDPVLLCDGGFIVFGGETYRSSDPVFGAMASLEALKEGVGDEIPALDMELSPPGDAAIADLSKPGYQTGRVRFWIGEYDVTAGTLDGTPDLMFDGQVDQTTWRAVARVLSVSVVNNAERVFELDIGNSLSPGFHKSVWPGELGHDNATGLPVPVAWGVESPPAATSGGSGGGYGGGRGWLRDYGFREVSR